MAMLVWAATCASPGETAVRRASLADLEQRVDLSALSISPDGRRVVLMTYRPRYATNEFAGELVLVDVATGVQEVVSPAPSRAHSPSWSPGGDRLAWLESAGDGRFHIYVRALDGPAPSSPIVTANVPEQGTGSPGMPRHAWSPDGRAIAFLAGDSRPRADGSERFNRSFEVTDGNYLAVASPVPSHVWLVASAGGEARRLTSGAESARSVEWSRDGRSILYVTQPRAVNGEFMRMSMRETSIKRIDIATLQTEVMVPPPAKLQSAPSVAPGADRFAYLRFGGVDPWSLPRELAVVPAPAARSPESTGMLDRDIDDFEWLPDSRHLLMTGPDEDRQALWLQPLNGRARRVDIGPLLHISDLTVSRTGVIAFIGSDADSPPEVFVMASVRARPRRVTHFNAALADLDLGRTETLRWSSDAFSPTGVVIYPPGFAAGRKYPLVLNIHGGPNSTSTGAFSLFDHILAAQGWVVLKPNYRGSNSHGRAFQGAMIGDLGAGPGRDVVAGIEALKGRGFIDTSRIALSGWSYGGYLSAWLIGHERGWSSAVIGVPITSYLDYYNLSCCNVWMDGMLKGSPWVGDNMADYWRNSPAAYMKGATTPTLILAHTGDAVAPITQSYALYHALRDNGAPVKFVVYPIGGHSISSDPVHERDKYSRWIDWIQRHFDAGPAAQAP